MNMIQVSKQVCPFKNFFSISLFQNENLDLQHQCFLNGEEYDLTIVDNAGSDQYSLNQMDSENSDAYILVYAIDDLQRFVS